MNGRTDSSNSLFFSFAIVRRRFLWENKLSKFHENENNLRKHLKSESPKVCNIFSQKFQMRNFTASKCKIECYEKSTLIRQLKYTKSLFFKRKNVFQVESFRILNPVSFFGFHQPTFWEKLWDYIGCSV